MVPATPTKSRIAIRLDKDTLAWFRKQVNAVGGGGYQALINDALREYIKRRCRALGRHATPRHPRRDAKRRVSVTGMGNAQAWFGTTSALVVSP